jgi:hypothetical protein
MSKDEIGDLIEALPQGLDADDFIYRLVNWAVDMEREACAALCSVTAAGRDAEAIEEAIRARGEKS